MGKQGKAEKQCGAATRKGRGPACEKAAGWGTDHPGAGQCKLHGGSTPNGKIAAEKQMAAEALATYGLPRTINPIDALLEELYRTAGHVAWLEMMVQKLEEDRVSTPVGGGGGGIPEQRPHVYIQMYAAERKHFKDVAKTCVDIGIEERRVAIAERQGQMLAQVINSILTKLNVPLDAPKTRKVIRQELTTIEAAPNALEANH